MPSGAKKRKAAKKKLEKQTHTFTNTNGSHPFNQGSDDPKFHDERESDGGDVEREENVEKGGVNNHDDESAKEVSLGDENVVERVKQKEENFQDGVVHTDDASREFLNATNKSSSSTSSSTSSSSSSSDDEVVVEKEKSEETEMVTPSDSVEEFIENSVDESFEESIPEEELVKQVVSLPQESTIVSESVPVDNLSTSDVIASELKQNLDEVVKPFDEKTEVALEVAELIPDKIEEKVIPVVNGDSENKAEPMSVIVRNDEGLPQSSGVKAVEGCHVDDNGKVSETHKYEEEQPLISSAPIPVRRTSWLNCCGLFEVFSGGSS